jgi:hypothetical protein
MQLVAGNDLILLLPLTKASTAAKIIKVVPLKSWEHGFDYYKKHIKY